jgi:hypothetical protein
VHPRGGPRRTGRQEGHRAPQRTCLPRSRHHEVRQELPWIQAPPTAPTYDEAPARKHWEHIYEGEFDVIPTPPGVADEALRREAFCDKPAKPDENKKGGARDAAIWLTVADFLRRHPQTQVYFVSNNSKDFGDGTSLPPQLELDLGQDGYYFTLLTSLEAVIAAVTKPVDVSAADQADVFEAPTGIRGHQDEGRRGRHARQTFPPRLAGRRPRQPRRDLLSAGMRRPVGRHTPRGTHRRVQSRRLPDR